MAHTTTLTLTLAIVAAAACAGCVDGASGDQASDTYVETRTMFAPADPYAPLINTCLAQHSCQPLCRTLFAVPAAIIIDRCTITENDPTGATVLIAYTKSGQDSTDVVLGTFVGDDDIDDDGGDDSDDNSGYQDDSGSDDPGDPGDPGDDGGDSGDDGGDSGGGDDGGDARIAPGHHVHAPAMPRNPTAGRQVR